MLAWSEGTDNGRQKTRNHGYDVSQAESYLPITPITSQTCHAKLKTQINRRRTLPASSRWWDAYRKQLGLKDSLRKVRTLWHCSRLRSVALYLWLIVVISVRQSTVAAISGLPGAGYGQFEHKADSLIAKFKEAGGTVREIDVWAESPRLFCSGYLHHRLPVAGPLIITVDNAITYKAQRDKNARELAGERGNYWHADASADVAALDAKYTKS